MDGDPAVEPALDAFSRVLPLPYRVALIIVLGTVHSAIMSQSWMLWTLLIILRRRLGLGREPPLSPSNQDRMLTSCLTS
jgi:hypothetical protein